MRPNVGAVIVTFLSTLTRTMTTSLPIDAAFLTQTLVDLVRIDSRNPSLTPGSPGEAAIGVYIADALRALDLDVTVHDLGGNRVNVVGILRGNGNGKSLLLNAHLDTVGVEGMDAPFSGELRDGRLYGRGSQDMKGSIAAMLAAAKALRDAQQDNKVSLAGDLLLTFVADEEALSLGMEDLIKRYRADAAIVTEPTDLQICCAHRGFVWCEITTHGRAAHGSRYAEGIDAIAHMGRVLVELEALGQELLRRDPHPLAGPPSLHASLIEGGTELSVYPARCTLKIERRTIPGETPESAAAEIQKRLDKLAAMDDNFRADLITTFTRSPFEIDEHAPIVQTLSRAATARLGTPPAHVGATFWTDAALLAEAGIPSVLIGPIGAGLHSAEEWVDVQSLVDLATILAETAVEFCQP